MSEKTLESKESRSVSKNDGRRMRVDVIFLEREENSGARQKEELCRYVDMYEPVEKEMSLSEIEGAVRERSKRLRKLASPKSQEEKVSSKTGAFKSGKDHN